jgi:PAS domain S-box-containing protein
MAHPLLCWDIIQEGMSRRMEFAKDIDILNKLSKENGWNFFPERALDNCIIWENKSIIVTSKSLDILFASKNIYKMNGYKPHEIIGCNPSIFQGKKTTEDERLIIRNAVKAVKPFDTTITNYRKDGSIYKCQIEGYPIFNIKKQLVNFIALENIIYNE